MRKKTFVGIKPTTKHIKDLLRKATSHLKIELNDEKELIQKVWKDVIGERFFHYTCVKGYYKNCLYINVSQATLRSVLASYEKQRILASLKRKLPMLTIKNIVFCLG